MAVGGAGPAMGGAWPWRYCAVDGRCRRRDCIIGDGQQLRPGRQNDLRRWAVLRSDAVEPPFRGLQVRRRDQEAGDDHHPHRSLHRELLLACRLSARRSTAVVESRPAGSRRACRYFAAPQPVPRWQGKDTPASRRCRRFLIETRKKRSRPKGIFRRREMGKLPARGPPAARFPSECESPESEKSMTGERASIPAGRPVGIASGRLAQDAASFHRTIRLDSEEDSPLPFHPPRRSRRRFLMTSGSDEDSTLETGTRAARRSTAAVPRVDGAWLPPAL